MSIIDLQLHQAVLSAFKSINSSQDDHFSVRRKLSRYKIVQTSRYSFIGAYINDMKELLTDNDTLNILINNDLVRTFKVGEVTYYRTKDSLFFNDKGYFDIVRIGSKYSGVDSVGTAIKGFKIEEYDHTPPTKEMYLSLFGLPTAEGSNITLPADRFGHFIDGQGQRCSIFYSQYLGDEQIALNVTNFDVIQGYVVREKHNFEEALLREIATAQLLCYSDDQVIVKKDGSFMLYDVEGTRLDWYKLKAGTFKLLAINLWEEFSRVMSGMFNVVKDFFNLIIDRVKAKFDKEEEICGTDLDAVKILVLNHYIVSTIFCLCVLVFFFPLLKFIVKKLYYLLFRRRKRHHTSVDNKIEEMSLYGYIPKKIACTFCSTVTWIKKGKFLCDPSVDVTKIISPGLLILTCLFIQVDALQINGTTAIATVPIKNGYCTVVENINGTMEICLDSARHYYSKTMSYQTGMYNVYYSKNRECKKNGEGTCSDGCIDPFKVIGNVNNSRSYCDYRSQPISKCFFQYSCDYYSCGFQPVDLYDVYVCDYIEDEYLLRINGAQYSYVAQENVEIVYGELSIMLTQSISNIDRVIHVFNDSFTSPRISYAMSPSFGQIGQIQTINGRTIWSDEVLSCTFDNVYLNDVDVFDSLNDNVCCDEYTCYVNITSKETILFTITMPIDRAFIMDTSPVKGNITAVDCFNTMQNFVRCNVVLNGTSNNFILNVTEPRDQDYICSSPCEINIENVSDKFMLCLESGNQFCGVVDVTSLRYNSTINGSPIYQKAKKAFEIWKIVLISISAGVVIVITIIVMWLIITKIFVPLIPSLISLIVYKQRMKKERINGIKISEENTYKVVDQLTEEKIENVFNSPKIVPKKRLPRLPSLLKKREPESHLVSVYDPKYKGVGIKNQHLTQNKFWHEAVYEYGYIYTPYTNDHCLFACQLLRELHLNQRVAVGNEIRVFKQLTPGQICEFGQGHVAYVSIDRIDDSCLNIHSIAIKLHECEHKRFFVLPFTGEINFSVNDYTKHTFLKIFSPSQYKSYLQWCFNFSRIPVTKEIFDIVTSLRLPILPCLSPRVILSVKDHYKLFLLSKFGNTKVETIAFADRFVNNLKISMLQLYLFSICDYSARLKLFDGFFPYIKGTHNLPDIKMNEYKLSANSYVSTIIARDSRLWKILLSLYDKSLMSKDLSSFDALFTWFTVHETHIVEAFENNFYELSAYEHDILKCYMINYLLSQPNFIISPRIACQPLPLHQREPKQVIMNEMESQQGQTDKHYTTFTPIFIRRYSFKNRCEDYKTDEYIMFRQNCCNVLIPECEIIITDLYNLDYRGVNNVVSEIQHQNVFVYSCTLPSFCYEISCLMKRYEENKDFEFHDYRVHDSLVAGEVCKWNDGHVCYCSSHKLDLYYDSKIFEINISGNHQKILWVQNPTKDIAINFREGRDEQDLIEFEDYKAYVYYCINNCMMPISDNLYYMLKFFNFSYFTKLSEKIDFRISELVALHYCYQENKITNYRYKEIKIKLEKKKVTRVQNVLCSMLPVNERPKCWPIILSQNVTGTEMLNNTTVSKFPQGCEKFIESITDIDKLIKLINCDFSASKKSKVDDFETEFKKDFGLTYGQVKEIIYYSKRQKDKYYDKNKCIGKIPASLSQFQINNDTLSIKAANSVDRKITNEVIRQNIESQMKKITIKDIIQDGKIVSYDFLLNGQKYNTQELKLVKTSIGLTWQFIHQSIILTPLLPFIEFNSEKIPILTLNNQDNVTLTHEYVNIYNIETLRQFFLKIPRSEIISVIEFIAGRNKKEKDKLCKKYNVSKRQCAKIDRLIGCNVFWTKEKMSQTDKDILLTYYDVLTKTYNGPQKFEDWNFKILEIMKSSSDYLKTCNTVQDIIYFFCNHVNLIKPLKYLIAGLMQHYICLIDTQQYHYLFNELAAIIEWTSSELEQPFVQIALMGDPNQDEKQVNKVHIICKHQHEKTDKSIPKLTVKYKNERELFLPEMIHWVNKKSIDKHRICYSLHKFNESEFKHRCINGMCMFSCCLKPDVWQKNQRKLLDFEKNHQNDNMWTNQSIYSTFSFFQEVDYGAIVSYKGLMLVLNPTAKVFVKILHTTGHMMASDELVTDPKLSMIPYSNGFCIDNYNMLFNFNGSLKDLPKECLYSPYRLTNASQFQIAKGDTKLCPVANYALRPDNPSKIIDINDFKIIETHLAPGNNQYKASHTLGYICGHSVSLLKFYPSMSYDKDNSGYFDLFGNLFFGFLSLSSRNSNILNVHTNSFMSEEQSSIINLLALSNIPVIGVINPVTRDFFEPLDEVTDRIGTYDLPDNVSTILKTITLDNNSHQHKDYVAQISVGNCVITYCTDQLSPEFKLQGDHIVIIDTKPTNFTCDSDLTWDNTLKEITNIKESKLIKRDTKTGNILLWDPKISKKENGWDIHSETQPKNLYHNPSDMTSLKLLSYFHYNLSSEYIRAEHVLNSIFDFINDDLISEDSNDLINGKTDPDDVKSSEIIEVKSSDDQDDDSSSSSLDEEYKSPPHIDVNIANYSKEEESQESKYKNLSLIHDFVVDKNQSDVINKFLIQVMQQFEISDFQPGSQQALETRNINANTIIDHQNLTLSTWCDVFIQDMLQYQTLLRTNHQMKIYGILSKILPKELCKVLNCILLNFDIVTVQHDDIVWLDTPLVTPVMVADVMKEVFDCHTKYEEINDIKLIQNYHTVRYLIHFAQCKASYVIPLPFTLTNVSFRINKNDPSESKALMKIKSQFMAMKLTDGNLRPFMKGIKYIDHQTVKLVMKEKYHMLPKLEYTEKHKLSIDIEDYINLRRQGNNPPPSLEDLLRAGSTTRQEVISKIFREDENNKLQFDSDFRFSTNIIDYYDKNNILNSYCIERPTGGFYNIEEKQLSEDTDYLQLLDDLLGDGYAVSKLYGITLYSSSCSRIKKYAVIAKRTLLLCNCDSEFKYYTTYIQDLNQQDIFYCKQATLSNCTLGHFEVSSHKFTNKFYHHNTKIYYTVLDHLMYITNHHDTDDDDVYSCLLNGYEFGKTYVATTTLNDGDYCYDGLEFYINMPGKMKVSCVGRILGLNNNYMIIGVDDSDGQTDKPLSGSSYFPYYNTMTDDKLKELVSMSEQDLENKSAVDNGVYYNKNKIIFVGMLPQSPYRSAVKSYVCSKNSGGHCFFSSGDCQHGTVKVINRFHQHKIDLEIAQKHFGGLVVDVTAGTTLFFCDMFCNVWNLNTPEGHFGPFPNIINITNQADAYIFGDCCYYQNVRQYYNDPRCYQISTYYEITPQSTSEYEVKLSNGDIKVQLDGEACPWVCSVEDMVSIMNNTRMIKKFTLNNITMFCGQYNNHCHLEHNILFTSKQRNEITIASNIKNAASKTTFLLTRTTLDPSTIPYAQNVELMNAWNGAAFYDQIEAEGFALAIERKFPAMHRILIAMQCKSQLEPETMFEELLRLILSFNIKNIIGSIENIIEGVINIYLGKTDCSNRFFKRLSENSIVPDGNIYYDQYSDTWKLFTQSQIMTALHQYELDHFVFTWKSNGEMSLESKIKLLWYMLCNNHSSISEMKKVISTWVSFMQGELELINGKTMDKSITYTDFIRKVGKDDNTVLGAIDQVVGSIPVIGEDIKKKIGLVKDNNKISLVSIPQVGSELLITINDSETKESVYYIILNDRKPFELMNLNDEFIVSKNKVPIKKNFSDCMKEWKYYNSYQREEILRKYDANVRPLKDDFKELCCKVSNTKCHINGKEMYCEFHKGIYLVWPFGNGTKKLVIKPDYSNINEKTSNYDKDSVYDEFLKLSADKVITDGIRGTTNIVFEPTVEQYDCHVNDTATYIYQPVTSAATVPFSSTSTISEVCKYRFSSGKFKKESTVKFAEFMKPILEDTIRAGIEFANNSGITIQDYINHLQGDKKKEAISALKNFNPSLVINNRYHMILKNDEMVITNPDKHARVIAAPERTHKLVIGYCAYIIEQFMIRHLRGFMIGKTGEEIRDIIMQDYRNGDNFVSLDTKAFDGSQHLPLQKTIDNELSKIAYMHILQEFGPQGTDVVTDLSNIGEIWNSFIKITCGFNVKGKYNLTGCVPSGHALHTTVANTYRAIYYQKYLLNDPEARIYAAGDDTLALLDDYELEKWKRNMNLVYSEHGLGQTLKELIVSKEYFTFCSMKFTLHDTVIKDLNNYVGRYMTFSNENPIHNFIQKTAAIMDWHNSTEFCDIIKNFSKFDEQLQIILKDHKEFMYLMERNKLLASKELYYTPVTRGVQEVDISDLYTFFPDIMQLLKCVQVDYDEDHHRPVTRFEFMTNSWYNQVLPNQIIGDFILPYDLDKLEQKISNVFEQIINSDCDMILQQYFEARSLSQKRY